MTDIGQGNILKMGSRTLANGKTRQYQDWEKYQSTNNVRRAKIKMRDKKSDEEKLTKIPKGKTKTEQ